MDNKTVLKKLSSNEIFNVAYVRRNLVYYMVEKNELTHLAQLSDKCSLFSSLGNGFLGTFVTIVLQLVFCIKNNPQPETSILITLGVCTLFASILFKFLASKEKKNYEKKTHQIEENVVTLQ